jgi:AraC-like DNA-binding protein
VSAHETTTGLVVASTKDVCESERVAFWCRLVAEHLGPVDVVFGDEQSIYGEMRIGRLGTLPLVSFYSTAFTARRRTTPTARTEAYAVTLQLSGTLRVEQEGRLAVLAAGDYCVYDTVLPYTVEARGESESLILLVPYGALDVPVSRVREQSVLPLRTASAASAVAGSFLLAAGYALHEHGGLGDRRISDSFMSLFCAAIADDKPDPWEGGTCSPGEVIVDRVKAYVIAHLPDLDLTPATVAAAHHISVRYLHKVFEREPVTVMELIRNSRLEACARDLADARLGANPVGSIGSANGIPDASTFSRLFRSAYGVSPRDYRAARLGPLLSALHDK